MKASMKVCERGTFFSYKSMQKGCLFCQNGIQNDKVLDLGGEPSCIKLCRATPPYGKLAPLLDVIINNSFPYQKQGQV